MSTFEFRNVPIWSWLLIVCNWGYIIIRHMTWYLKGIEPLSKSIIGKLMSLGAPKWFDVVITNSPCNLWEYRVTMTAEALEFSYVSECFSRRIYSTLGHHEWKKEFDTHIILILPIDPSWRSAFLCQRCRDIRRRSECHPKTSPLGAQW